MLVKTTQNTKIEEINIIKNPKTRSMIDRYLFASSYCYGKEVVSVASGWGYGEEILLALGAKSVKCIDSDLDAIYYINSKCNPYLSGMCVDIFKFKPIEKFDVVVSIETMEHLPKKKVDKYLELLNKLCRENGVIMITTPNRTTERFIYQPGSTHLYEYSFKEFEALLLKHFKGQNITYLPLVEFNVPNIFGYFTGIVNENNSKNARINFAIIKKIKKGDLNEN